MYQLWYLEMDEICLKIRRRYLMTETELVFKRNRLRQLLKAHPEWTGKQLAQEVDMSEGWVKKWRGRLKSAEPGDYRVLWSQSRRPKRVQGKVTPALEVIVLSIRDDPPDGLQRTPGCDAIHYYLQNAPEVKRGEVPLICPKTINRILHKHQRIPKPSARQHTPLVRAAAMEEWEMDFKDVITVQAEATDKRMHQVETLNVVDCGTSILVDNPARLDYNAETVIAELVEVFAQRGLPKRVRFDRDPRFVGSAQSRDFPSALTRFLLCLGVEPIICPPQRPDKNPFVERYNRTYKYEAILVYHPQTLQQTQNMNQTVYYHYNYQRPNQALSCRNRPPCRAFAELPALPPLPQSVDPDAWLDSLHGRTFLRRVNASGGVKLDKHYYHIRRDLKGDYVALHVDAAERSLKVTYAHQMIKTIPLKGLVEQTLSLEAYVSHIQQQAVSEWRRYLAHRPRRLPLVA
jgi:transposase InsO family protein